MKYEWKKQEKELYGAGTTPCVVDVPSQKYITISGIGNPNSEPFSEKVSALFSAAYKIKMVYKSQTGGDYSVYPLEGIWSRSSEKDELIKSELRYVIMIRQPDFIDNEIFDAALESVKRRTSNIYLPDISFETIQDGKCIQILHRGAFDDEPASFEVMEQYCLRNGLKRIGKSHREIYLNNANRTEKSNLKTILRYRITHRQIKDM